LVGLPAAGVSPQHGLADRSHSTVAASCRPLQGMRDRQDAAQMGAAVGPYAGRCDHRVKARPEEKNAQCRLALFRLTDASYYWLSMISLSACRSRSTMPISCAKPSSETWAERNSVNITSQPSPLATTRIGTYTSSPGAGVTK